MLQTAEPRLVAVGKRCSKNPSCTIKFLLSQSDLVQSIQTRWPINQNKAYPTSLLK